MGFPGSSAGKEFTYNAGDPGSIAGSGRVAGEGISYPCQYSWAFLVAQLAKYPPAKYPQVWCLCGEDPLENGYPLQYSGLENTVHGGREESDTTERLSLSLSMVPLTTRIMGSICIWSRDTQSLLEFIWLPGPLQLTAGPAAQNSLIRQNFLGYHSLLKLAIHKFLLLRTLNWWLFPDKITSS